MQKSRCGFNLVQCRMEAITFHEKMGYQKEGSPFEIPDVGEHIMMFKKNKNE